MKEYQFICAMCKHIFTSRNIKCPLCRFCLQKTGMCKAEARDMYGNPTPTDLQQTKWNETNRVLELLKKQNKRK